MLFAAAIVVAIPFLLYVHRRIGPFQDEWLFLLDHFGFSPHALFGEPAAATRHAGL